MKRLMVRILAVIGGAVVGMLLVGTVTRLALRGHVPRGTVVELDIERPLAEYAPNDPLAGLLHSRQTLLRDVLDGLVRARDDERVAALVVRIGQAPGGLAQIQELRDAVADFRTSGKRAIAFAETFGEFGPGNGVYYLASAFGEIYLQPSGDIGLTGLLAEVPFVRGTLDKLGITPRFGARAEYKNAVNTFTEKQFTEPHRQSLSRLVESQFGQMVSGIAAARGLDERAVRALVDRAPLSAQEALDAKLVDGLAYRDEVTAKLEEGGRKPRRMSLARYLARAGGPEATGDVVALIHGVGAVHRGRSRIDPLSGDVGMGSDTVTAAFRAAVDDDRVRAILFRVDSPGGSYIASDTIWREVSRARAAGRPVVVSMGDVAASGGYFVAVPADKIVAQPGTITGSIGVFAGKMLTGDFWEKLGVTFDDVQVGRNATMWSALHDYTAAEHVLFDGALDRIYDDFTGKVAAGRRLPLEQVRRVAKGRVWTGEDALAQGLVDALGGYPEALRQVRVVLGLGADAPLELESFPPRRGLVANLLQRAVAPEDESAEEEPEIAVLRAGLDAVHAATRALGAAGLLGDADVLRLPRSGMP
jgi:protease-4